MMTDPHFDEPTRTNLHENGDQVK